MHMRMEICFRDFVPFLRYELCIASHVWLTGIVVLLFTWSFNMWADVMPAMRCCAVLCRIVSLYTLSRKISAERHDMGNPG